MKLYTELEEVRCKAQTFAATTSGFTVKQSVEQCLEVLSHLHTLTARHDKIVDKKENKDNDGLTKARDETFAFAQKVVSSHAVNEAKSWLCQQAETLRASRIMSKPPAFDVLKLLGETKRVLGNELISLSGLCRFYAVCESLAGDIESLLKTPQDRQYFDEKRKFNLSLCRCFSEWQDAKKTVLVSFNALLKPVEELEDAINELVNIHCVETWRVAIAVPAAIVADMFGKPLVKLNEEDTKQVSELKQALEKITDAQVLTTGLQDHTTQAEARLAGDFLDGVMRVSLVLSMGSSTEADLVKAVMDALQAIGVAKADAWPLVTKSDGDAGEGMSVKLAVDVTQQKVVASAVCTAIWQSDAGESRSVLPGTVLSFMAPWFRFVTIHALVTQDGILAEANSTLQRIVNASASRLAELLDQFVALGSLPEHTGNHKSFITAVNGRNLQQQVARLNDGLEAARSEFESACTAVGLEPAEILPTVCTARATGRKCLSLCCTFTVAKILESKAAKTLSMCLKPSVEQTLGFAKDLDLPPALMAELRSLHKKLQESAASATEHSSKRQRQS